MVIKSVVISLVFVMALSSCGPSNNINGQLLGYKSNKPITAASILLCPITGESECELSTKYRAISEIDGRFQLSQIPPGQYVIVYGFEEAKLKEKEWILKRVKYDNFDSLLRTFGNGEVLICTTSTAQAGYRAPVVGLMAKFSEGSLKVTDTNLTALGGAKFIMESSLVGQPSGPSSIQLMGASVFSERFGLFIEFINSRPLLLEIKPGENKTIVIKVTEAT